MSNPNVKDYAAKGGRARWMPRATHQGVLKIMGKKLPCFVLEDGTRLISQTSVFQAFGRKQRGLRTKSETGIVVPSFLDAKNLELFITNEIQSQIRPITFIGTNGSECIGYRAETIPIVCDIYLSVRESGKLTTSQIKIAEMSELMVRSLSKVGIVALVDEATGYQEIRPRDALEAYLNKILTKELATWCKRFPDAYYENIYLLKGWPKFSTSVNKYSCVGHYTNDIIYSRLGNDVLNELKTRTPDTSKNSMHQWLTTDTGHPLLSQHMHAIIGIQRLALAQGYGWNKFKSMVDMAFPVKKNALESTLI